MGTDFDVCMMLGDDHFYFWKIKDLASLVSRRFLIRQVRMAVRTMGYCVLMDLIRVFDLL
jgi:hypothetical protein